MSTGLLAIRGVAKRYGYRPVLRDIDLKLAPGELVCLLGPNGAGKSSLLATLISRNPPDEGEICFHGDPIRTLEERRRFLARTAFLGHDPGLLLDLSAAENLDFFLRLYRRRPAPDDAARIAALLRRTGLESRRDDRVRTYSRGMQQRLGLCRVFLTAPDLVLLDEPLTGLDPEGARALLALLGEFMAGGGAALITTHDEAFFRKIASRFVFLKQGRLIADIPGERYSESARARVQEMLYGPERT